MNSFAYIKKYHIIKPTVDERIEKANKFCGKHQIETKEELEELCEGIRNIIELLNENIIKLK